MQSLFMKVLLVVLVFTSHSAQKCDAIPPARLPSHLKPTTYDIRLLPHVDPAFEWKIDGNVRIKLTCDVPGSKNITLHALEVDGIDVSSVEVQKADNSTIDVTDVFFEVDDNFVVVMLEEELIAGEEYFLEITSFTATLNDKLLGFYRSKYLNDGAERWMGITQFQTGHARKAFPCMDEPGLKAEFRVTLGRRDTDGWMTLSNMPLIETVPIEGNPGYVWDIYQPTPQMSTYLVAFCVAQFEHVQSSTDERVKVWARPDMLHKSKFAAEEGGKLLKIFEEELHIPFALPKLDLIAITDFYYGAMENWGLITFKEAYLVLDNENKTSTAKETMNVISILAHELAHQWFGNLVTPQWWNDLWLSEGFACYFDYIGTQKTRPAWNLMDAYFTAFETQDDLRTDSVSATANPVYTEIGDPLAVGGLKVCKGSPLLHMLRRQIGESTFRKAVRSYLKANKFSVVDTETLWQFFQAAAEEDGAAIPNYTIKNFMSGWVTQRGSPVVTLTRHDNGTATLEQERFFILPNEEDEVGQDYDWFIGVNFNAASEDFNRTVAEIWMTNEEPSLTLTENHLPSNLESWAVDESRRNWVIVNAKETGFYRVSYDTRSWKMIAQQLADDHTNIAPENRAQLLDDAFNLALAGKFNFSLVLDLTTYLAVEEEYGPWEVARRIWDFLDVKLKGARDGYDLLKDYLRCLLGPQFTPLLTLEEIPVSYDGVDVVKVFKYVMIQDRSCKYDWEPCLDEAHSQYQTWMALYDQQQGEPNSDTMNPNIKSIIFCNGVKAGSSEEWDHAWKYYSDVSMDSERRLMVEAMACTQDEALLNRYLERIFQTDSSLASQHTVLAFRSIVEKSVLGRDLAFGFLVDNFDLLLANFSSGDYLFGDFIRPFSTYASQEAAQKLNELKESHEGNLAGAEATFDQVVKRIEENVQWMNGHYAELVGWLETSLSIIGCERASNPPKTVE